MKVIGLAGRVGSGKSAVARLLSSVRGVEWIDLDRVAWETYEPGTETFGRVVERFGDEIVAEDGTIDRGELAVRVFVEAGAKEDLEAIVHPAIVQRLRTLCDEERARGTDVLLVEGALLTTSPHVDRSVFDAVIWLDASDPVRRKRLQAAGRGDHAPRGDDLSPNDGSIAVDAEGAIDEVAERVWSRVQAL